MKYPTGAKKILKYQEKIYVGKKKFLKYQEKNIYVRENSQILVKIENTFEISATNYPQENIFENLIKCF